MRYILVDDVTPSRTHWILFVFKTQNCGQMSGELLRRLDDERLIVKSSIGPRYVVGCRPKVTLWFRVWVGQYLPVVFDFFLERVFDLFVFVCFMGLLTLTHTHTHTHARARAFGMVIHAFANSFIRSFVADRLRKKNSKAKYASPWI